MLRPLMLLLVALWANLQAATYTVVPAPQTRSLIVTVGIDKPAERFRMPAWAPGDYRIVNFGRLVASATFTLSGREVRAERGSDPNLWTLPEGADTVSYTVSSHTGIFSEDVRVSEREYFFNGPAALGWFEGHASEKHTLRLALKPSGAFAQCALDPLETSDAEFAVYTAPDYDTLIDSPAAVGTTVRTKEFSVRGKPHYIVAFNKSTQIELASFAKVCSQIVEQTYRMFGELPYQRYMFMLDVGGPGGGLEHANSARLAIPPGANATWEATFLAHEYVHAFNVKRLRPRALGPFDYTRRAETGLLWWMEGVTDYYAEVLCYRAGLRTRSDILDALSEAQAATLNNPRRFKVSADESSRRVWEANNSSGYGINYYQKGKLIGFCLDLAIRAASNGRRSLDDVMVAAYTECKGGKPGLDERRLRELCLLFGNEWVADIYDKCVYEAGDLPFDFVLPQFGFKWNPAASRFEEEITAAPNARRLAEAWPSPTE